MSDEVDLLLTMAALKSELKEAVASLQAERKANASNTEAVASLQAELVSFQAKHEADTETVARLNDQLQAKDDAVRKLKTVVAEINSDATLQARRHRLDASATSIEPLDPDNPMKRVGANVLSESTTTHTCRNSVTIHEEPAVFLEAIIGDQVKEGKTLYQKVVEEGVGYWSFMINNTKSCDLLIRMRVERQDEAGVVVKIESVDEEGESGDEGKERGEVAANMRYIHLLQSSKRRLFRTLTQWPRKNSGFYSRRGRSSCSRSHSVRRRSRSRPRWTSVRS